MAKIVNLTPHTIDIVASNGDVISILSTGLARVSVTSVPAGTLTLPDGRELSLSRQEAGEVTGLPPAEDGVVFIVSAVVLSALKGTRTDCWGPDTGSTAKRQPALLENGEKNPKAGQIIAVMGLTQTL